jgi:hypothetical protein
MARAGMAASRYEPGCLGDSMLEILAETALGA